MSNLSAGLATPPADANRCGGLAFILLHYNDIRLGRDTTSHDSGLSTHSSSPPETSRTPRTREITTPVTRLNSSSETYNAPDDTAVSRVHA